MLYIISVLLGVVMVEKCIDSKKFDSNVEL